MKDIRIHIGLPKQIDLQDLPKPTFRPGVKIAQHFEAELLMFADHFKTRRVYVVNWHKDENFRIDFYYKCFKYEDRAIAYDVARHYYTHVQIYDFKNLIDKPLEYIASIPSPNRREAMELWKTFNTCCVCHSETEQCENVLFRGKKDRMCKHCIDKFVQWPTKGG
jgi:hypothetical protein